MGYAERLKLDTAMADKDHVSLEVAVTRTDDPRPDTDDLPAEVAEEDGAPVEAPDVVMSMLHEHVPLSLVIDLTDPHGPDSESILDEEGQPEEEWWIQP